jgi:2-keto-4-pentenoate hydratase/2-oxohepta-3-ene-1,7-dioic acid hydratase in catechol pathway
MRIANLNGRLALVRAASAVDVAKASGGEFGPDPQAVYERWPEFVAWAASADLPPGEPFAEADLGSPAPTPRQVFAIGLNYREHADESGFAVPAGEPPVFTKFPSCVTGPYGHIELPPGGHTDWEVELVAVIGRRAHRVSAEDAPSYLAGYAVGQDLSERRLQLAATPPQFSLGKSLPCFGPIGPWLVTLDEFPDPNDLRLSCAVNGEQMQQGRTRDLIYPVPELVRRLSASVPLLPGDVIFTGTPAGVGLGRTPPRWLRPGDELVSRIDGIGELRHRFVAAQEGQACRCTD